MKSFLQATLSQDLQMDTSIYFSLVDMSCATGMFSATNKTKNVSSSSNIETTNKRATVTMLMMLLSIKTEMLVAAETLITPIDIAATSID